LRRVQILRCLKLKYLLFFPARRVSRYVGMDVNIFPLFFICFTMLSIVRTKNAKSIVSRARGSSRSASLWLSLACYITEARELIRIWGFHCQDNFVVELSFTLSFCPVGGGKGPCLAPCVHSWFFSSARDQATFVSFWLLSRNPGTKDCWPQRLRKGSLHDSEQITLVYLVSPLALNQGIRIWG
jgi:hypothetical protein